MSHIYVPAQHEAVLASTVPLPALSSTDRQSGTAVLRAAIRAHRARGPVWARRTLQARRASLALEALGAARVEELAGRSGGTRPAGHACGGAQG